MGNEEPRGSGDRRGDAGRRDDETRRRETARGERAEPIEERPQDALAGAELLRTGNSRDVLRRLWEHDPFEVESRCIEHLVARRLLLDLGELYAHSLAYVAHDASEYDGSEALDAWLTDRIERAAGLLLDTDRQREREAFPIVEPYQPRYLFLSGAVGIEPGLGRRACILFNSMPEDERRAFWAVQVDGKDIEELVAEGHGPIELARRRLRKVIQTLSRVGNLELPPEDDQPFPEEVSEAGDER